MMSLRFLLLAVALLATANAFCPTVSSVSLPKPSQIYSTLHGDDNHDNKDDPNVVQPLELALKMAGVLTIKTAKDMINYPPMLLDQLSRDISGKNQANPVVMLTKLMGVLFFKMVHDAVYFPMIWTQRWSECQSLEECTIDDDNDDE